jgi:hypothetical protein
MPFLELAGPRGVVVDELERLRLPIPDLEWARGFHAKGGEGRNRTGDTTVFSRVLYQLSYLAARRKSIERRLGP